LYGSVRAGEVPLSRVQFWHPTSNVALGPADVDWGDLPRGTSLVRSFRVKNLSSTQTATSVLLSMDVPTDKTPSLSSSLDLSQDNSSFSSTVSVASIAPGALSSVLYARASLVPSQSLAVALFRLRATVGSWV
jgi:hypothetical protein